jgi:hypothetical protein
LFSELFQPFSTQFEPAGGFAFAPKPFPPTSLREAAWRFFRCALLGALAAKSLPASPLGFHLSLLHGTMIKKYLTHVVFGAAILLSLVSLGLVFVLVEPYVWVGIVVLGVSVAFNLWSVRRSENSGFIQSREFRRAHEPARRFNMLQVFVMFAFVMVQCGVGAYAIIT